MILKAITFLTILPFLEAAQCSNSFPLETTSNIIKTLIETYAQTVNYTDGEDTWINHLILMNKNGYELDGITYYINDNSLAPENTFYFDSLQFLSFPAFVVDAEEHVKEWKPTHPDLTYSLSKISLKCGRNERACGLTCCPHHVFQVLEGIKKTLITANRPNDTYIRDGITYGLHDPQKETTCVYYLSSYDLPLRSYINEHKKIFFTCSRVEDCCGLTCLNQPHAERVQFGGTATEYMKKQFKDHFYSIGSVFFLFLSLIVVAKSCRNNNDSESKRSSISDGSISVEEKLINRTESSDIEIGLTI